MGLKITFEGSATLEEFVNISRLILTEKVPRWKGSSEFRLASSFVKWKSLAVRETEERVGPGLVDKTGDYGGEDKVQTNFDFKLTYFDQEDLYKDGRIKLLTKLREMLLA